VEIKPMANEIVINGIRDAMRNDCYKLYERWSLPFGFEFLVMLSELNEINNLNKSRCERRTAGEINERISG
jgi:hypothetical protein